MEANPILRLEDVSTAFGKKTVFRNVNLELQANESVVIMGQSGVGKTSLLNMILGLVPPTGGANSNGWRATAEKSAITKVTTS